MQVEMRPIDAVVPYARNPRKNAAAVDKVAASLREFGWRQPIVVDAAGVIVVGHTRYEAARRLGMAEVPVHVAADLTPQQAKAYRLVDNRAAQFAEWDADLLRCELDELADVDLGAFDFERLANQYHAEGVDAPVLADGDRAPFRQATFTLHDEQWEEVEAALAKAKSEGGGESAVNENSNGNALAWVCGRYNRGQG